MAGSLSAVYRARDYVQRALDPKYEEKLLEEHLNIINTPIIGGTSDTFRLPRNRKKNRNLDYPCWDISRVVLKSYRDSDYINANYLRGFDLNCKFIATQEPMATTFDDFWNMVWQENSQVIVMLNDTRSEPPTLQHFSANQDHTILTQFVIQENCIAVEPQYTLTALTLTHIQTTESRTIHHFKYLDWSETSIPQLPLFLNFVLVVNRQHQKNLSEALQTNQSLPGPIVVHCDNGIGRTAIFCAVDICLYQLVNAGSVSVASIVLKVRQQRNFSIQTPRDYIFINNVMLHFLMTIKSNIDMFFELRSHLTENDIDLLSLNNQTCSN